MGSPYGSQSVWKNSKCRNWLQPSQSPRICRDDTRAGCRGTLEDLKYMEISFIYGNTMAKPYLYYGITLYIYGFNRRLNVRWWLEFKQFKLESPLSMVIPGWTCWPNLLASIAPEGWACGGQSVMLWLPWPHCEQPNLQTFCLESY